MRTDPNGTNNKVILRIMICLELRWLCACLSVSLLVLLISLSLCLSHTHAHARTHTHKHAHTHARTCTHAHAHTHTHTRARARARARCNQYWLGCYVLRQRWHNDKLKGLNVTYTGRFICVSGRRCGRHPAITDTLSCSYIGSEISTFVHQSLSWVSPIAHRFL